MRQFSPSCKKRLQRTTINNIKKIGVISDTHIPSAARHIPDIVFEIFKDTGLIIHAGDHTSPDVITELKAIAPVISVRGNMDGPELSLPEDEIVDINGKFKIAVCHGAGPHSTTLQRMNKKYSKLKPDLIIFGHTHHACDRIYAGIHMFNPGSPTCGGSSRSVGIITVEETTFFTKIIIL